MRIEDRPEFKSKPQPLTASADASVTEVAREMGQRNFGSVVVLDNDSRVAGIFTERDLLRRVVAEGRDPASTKLSDVMTAEVRVASASDDVVDWLRQMSNERFRHVPVVDEGGKLVHMMSQGDFVSYTWPELLTRIKEQATHAYPKASSLVWLTGGILVYTLLLVALLQALV